MKIIEIEGQQAVVELAGTRRQANIMFLDNPAVGDYVLLHAGFAIQKINQRDAEETLSLLKDNI